jgi:sulfoxide reductase heme-binding subunit YedZ
LSAAALKPVVFAASLLPLFWLIWLGFSDRLGANPIEAITHYTGDWTLRYLLITLGMRPLHQSLGWSWSLKLRRMLGLFAFFYASLHFLTYIVLDQFFSWPDIVEDIAKRPFITVGFTAFVLLVPLAITSTNAMMRRLKRRWQALHRLVYIIALCGVLHFVWLVKADLLEPLIYLLILMLLFSYRLLKLIAPATRV